jgi:indolepyruvate ferredoxin oxidoreductase, beta subunit
MSEQDLKCDPYNLIITGVGGQGNVLASRMIGDMLSLQGFDITIGETFGASQRGGSVMSHLRASHNGSHSPQIPEGKAHMILSLEPTEALRVLKVYGNPEVQVITNTRPLRSVGVISGELKYPNIEEITDWLNRFSSKAWLLDTTDGATDLGNPIFSNVMMVGALSAVKELPLEASIFETVIRSRMSEEKVAVNLKAFDLGRQMIENIS